MIKRKSPLMQPRHLDLEPFDSLSHHAKQDKEVSNTTSHKIRICLQSEVGGESILESVIQKAQTTNLDFENFLKGCNLW